MPRSKKIDDAGPVQLTDEEAGALQNYYAIKIEAAQKAAGVIKAQYDAALKDVSGFFAQVKADLRYTRKDFEEFLAKRAMSEAEFRNSEAKRNRMFHNGGLAVGAQLQLFAPQDTVDDKEVAYHDGLRAGRRADDPVPPTYISSMLHSDWLRGWHDGQAENAQHLAKAEDILAKRGEPDATEDPVELNTDPDEEDDGSPEALRKAANRLKSSGFMDRQLEPALN